MKHAFPTTGNDNTLAYGFPSSPRRPPTITFSITTDTGKRETQGFCAPYSAKKFLEALSPQLDFKWLSDKQIMIPTPDDHLTLTANIDLNDLVEYEYTPLERKWELPADYFNKALAMTRQAFFTPQPGVDYQSPSPSEPTSKRRRKKQPSSEQSTSTSSPPAKKATSGNVTTIATIASQLGLTPGEARQRLRKAKIAKPTSGRWEWTDKADIDAIKAAIK